MSFDILMKQAYKLEEDLIVDEQFLAWYERRSESAVNAWEQKMDQDNELRLLSQNSAALLDQIILKEKAIDPSQKDLASAKLLATLKEIPSPQSSARIVSLNKKRVSWKWAAAAVILLSLAGWIGWTLTNSNEFVNSATAFGEIKSLDLPDGSTVTLNANTQIRYSGKWKEGKEREVWVNGEAFFHVRKTSASDRFIVHTSKFDVVVTGTRFNVTDREKRAGVLLQEGAVTVNHGGNPAIELIPGDWVVLGNAGLEKKEGKNAHLLAWKDRRMVFEKTPLKEVSDLIEETYGVPVAILQTELENAPISGGFPTDNLDLLLNALGSSPDFHVTRSAENITFSKK